MGWVIWVGCAGVALVAGGVTPVSGAGVWLAGPVARIVVAGWRCGVGRRRVFSGPVASVLAARLAR